METFIYVLFTLSLAIGLIEKWRKGPEWFDIFEIIGVVGFSAVIFSYGFYLTALYIFIQHSLLFILRSLEEDRDFTEMILLIATFLTATFYFVYINGFNFYRYEEILILVGGFFFYTCVLERFLDTNPEDRTISLIYFIYMLITIYAIYIISQENVYILGYFLYFLLNQLLLKSWILPLFFQKSIRSIC